VDVSAIPMRRLPRVDFVRLAVRLAVLLLTVVLSVPYAAGWVAGVVASGVQWTVAAVAAGWRDGRAR
jgi:hypothetical protein